MQKNKKIGLSIAGVVVLIAAFYGGMVYGGNNVRAAISSRGQSFGQNGRGNFRGMGNGSGIGGFTTGKVIAKDANSITVSLQNGGIGSTGTGGSKIIFLNASTKISKSVSGTAADLSTGSQVMVSGTANTDGSITAETVQIRPNMPQSAKVQ